ncbi:MAG TPA: hypothetical protein VHL80_14695 [Polyangia bacterium]|nr:hypothetical protein [Polyangia bacterium]
MGGLGGLGLLLSVVAWLLAQASAQQAPPATAPVAAPETETAPQPPPASQPEAPAPPAATPPQVQTLPPEEEAPPPPLPPPPPEPLLYGYKGMGELSVALGYSSASGVLGGAGFRSFVVDGLAPGFEASVQTGDGTTIGMLLGSLRVAPVRTRQLAVVLTGRAGRVLISHHDDGWGAGAGAGVIWFVAPHAGLELGYEVLWLLPRSFCADLTSCTVQGPVIGLRFSF